MMTFPIQQFAVHMKFLGYLGFEPFAELGLIILTCFSLPKKVAFILFCGYLLRYTAPEL